jgi:excisionase family DNA binding protein
MQGRDGKIPTPAGYQPASEPVQKRRDEPSSYGASSAGKPSTLVPAVVNPCHIPTMSQTDTHEVHGKMLPPGEVASLLGCSTRTIYRRVHSGHLPAFRLKGAGPNPPLRIAVDDLADWLESDLFHTIEDRDA